MAKNGWVKHNQDVFKKALAEHRNALEKRLTNMLHELAEGVIGIINASDFRPMYTSNLADSTGLGVYFNGMLKKYIPLPRAKEPQEYNGALVWGQDSLEQALFEASQTYTSGIWVVLFSAVPYAFKVNEWGTETEDGKTLTPAGYFDEQLVPDMLNQFKLAFAREFPNIKLTV